MESRFQQLVSFAPLAGLDCEGKFLWGSPSFLKMLDIDEQSLTNESLPDHLLEDDSDEVHQGMTIMGALSGNREWSGFLRTARGEDRPSMVFARLIPGKTAEDERLLLIEDQTRVFEERKALEQEKTRYKLALTGAKFAIYDWEIQTDGCLMSPEFYEMTGLTPEQYNGSQYDFGKRIHPDDEELVTGALDRLMEGNPTLDVEYRFLNGRGKWVWLRARGTTVKDEHGKVRRMVGSIEDIHERKKAEESIRAIEKRFRQAIHAASGAAYELRVDENSQRSHYIFIDENIEEYTGIPPHKFSREGLVSMEKEIVFRDRSFKGDRVSVREKFWNGELPVYHADLKIVNQLGEERWLSDHSVPVFDEKGEKVIGSLGIIMDITWRKKMELDIQRQLSRMELYNRITRFVAERRNQEDIVDVILSALRNDLPANLVAFLVPGRDASTMRCTHFDSEPGYNLRIDEEIRLQEDQLARLRGGDHLQVAPCSTGVCSISARLRPYTLRSVVLLPIGPRAKSHGILMVARTSARAMDREELEFLEQLCQHAALALEQQQLYDNLEAAYRDLKQTQMQLMRQERLRAMGQMASGIAHDINNALAPLTMYPEMLLATMEDLSPEVREVLNLINNSALNIAQTVSRLGELYRQREGEDERRPVDLNSLIKRMVDLTRPRWRDIARQQGAEIRVELDLAEDLPFLNATESELRDAITNLLFNAIDAMPDGGVLTMRTAVEEEGILLVCRDTGKGMDAETINRCLEPFFTTKGSTGTGLGLPMVQAVIDRHFGSMNITSAPGEGTSFEIHFPLRRMVPDQDFVHLGRSPTPLALSIDFSEVHLLLVEDDQAVRRALSTALVRDGFDLVVVESGAEALEAFQSAITGDEKFDIVITDLGMPGIDGIQLSEKLRDIQPGIPIILLTGWGRHFGRYRQHPETVDIVLSKPPLMQEIRDAVRKLLTGRMVRK